MSSSAFNLVSGSWLALSIVGTMAQASVTHCQRNGLWTHSYAARHNMPQSATLGLHPVIHVPNYMDHYSFTDPRDGRLSWPCWLTDSRWLKHKVVTHPASRLAQDRENSPVETSILTTMLRRQLTWTKQCGVGINVQPGADLGAWS